ncbi:uncharacterized protein LOC119079339 [Bradysia coprophila]|uniref:uncharacterized protein LOC119079339 n=1 Tax=Bradysia coprophila TaxID=38358 RepID=UPI00187DB70E|nr:uncharacterized protein LOC119079339 [Bradysia coprophila]
MKKILVFLLLSIFVNGAVSQRLKTYNVDPYSITVSGFSSGAMMATQFHFAHSSKIAGAGIISGVPNLCAADGKDAVDFCLFNPTAVNVSFLIEQVNDLANRNLIDSVANIAGDKVFIYHGTKDTAILPASGQNVLTMYTNYGADIETEFTIPFKHGFPTMKNIGYDGAFHMLNHLYGGMILPADDAGNFTNLLTFDQSEFFALHPILSSMSTSGLIYVPTACRNGERCRLHIMFHGCFQNRGTIGNTFASTKVDIMGVAEVNNIIVLLPQISAVPFINPYACWDWFAYLDDMYATRKGQQIYAVYLMGTRVVAG